VQHLRRRRVAPRRREGERESTSIEGGLERSRLPHLERVLKHVPFPTNAAAAAARALVVALGFYRRPVLLRVVGHGLARRAAPLPVWALRQRPQVRGRARRPHPLRVASPVAAEAAREAPPARLAGKPTRVVGPQGSALAGAVLGPAPLLPAPKAKRTPLNFSKAVPTFKLLCGVLRERFS